MDWPIAMVTGHRPQHLLGDGVLEWVSRELNRIAVKLSTACGTETMISGMALGSDLLWAQAARHRRIPLRAHVPFPQQPDAWGDETIVAEYRKLLEYAHSTGGVVTHGDLDGLSMADRKGVAIALVHKRNKGMIAETVAAGGVCVAVLRSTKTTGGTWSAYHKAVDDGVAIIRVDPDRRTVTLPPPKTQATKTHEQGTLI